MAPRPPALDTAATSAGAWIEPMPPSAIGCSICSTSQTGVRIMTVSREACWLFVEHGDRTDRRAGTAPPFERQSDEAEFALADQRLEIAEAFDVGDVELEAGLVHERVHHADRSGPHGVDAEMHDALPRQPLGGGDVHSRIVGRIGRRREGAF